MTAMHPLPSLKDQVSPEEWQTRVDLAAAYRLVAANGWDDLIFTHLSARVPGPQEHFLINPFGLLFADVTASNLVKVDCDGMILSPTTYPVNPAGFLIHSCLHHARPDVTSVMHTHTVAGIAVAAQEDGLLPISQMALTILNEVRYHDYEGIALNPDEQSRLVHDLGPRHILILRNHGLLVAGRSIAEAYLLLSLLEKACAIQLAAHNGSAPLLIQSPAMAALVHSQARNGFGSAAQIAWAGLKHRLDRTMPDYAE
ncbi:class II aldolase/adducin family protein [Govanella unica]|uniref:Class II aldolase/adducin family protein n=1 Tax=Govanella unica TaxID=2975056 RepID=A0A9X3Z7G5_9PROT|nr:class II aldolase/adducin family protein [Govania unica]MDA5194146.1 class II aldolase/adducin family protein [Govania unica]